MTDEACCKSRHCNSSPEDRIAAPDRGHRQIDVPVYEFNGLTAEIRIVESEMKLTKEIALHPSHVTKLTQSISLFSLELGEKDIKEDLLVLTILVEGVKR